MATMSARYTVIDGEVVAQERGGVRHQIVPDALGSTVALYDDSGTKTDTLGYWPYGESSSRTGSTTLPFQYIGTHGYRRDSDKQDYVRARYLNPRHGRWISVDPFWPEEDAYTYVKCKPYDLIDPSGLSAIGPILCIGACTGAIGCIGGTLYGCDQWENLGYTSYFECALDSFQKLPPYAQIGCGLATLGCLTCLVRGATKCKKPVCPPSVRKALDKAVGAACKSPGSKRKCLPLRSRLQSCSDLRQASVRRGGCIAARLTIMGVCFAGGDNEHWGEVGKETGGLATCLAVMKAKGCKPFGKD